MSKKPLILFSLLLAAFVITLDTTIVNVALPTLVRELDASNTQLQWVVDAFNLFFAATVLAAGSLSDRFGRKGMLLAGLVVFGLSSLVGGLMDSPDRLIAARAVMGVGAAMVFPATLSLLTNVFTERRERALAIGLWGAITGAAIALGPIVGGWLLEFSDWRSIFFAMTPIAAIAGVLVAGYVPTSRDPRAPRTDRAGFALSTATIGLLVYTIIEAPDQGWASTRTLAGFALTAVLAAAFVAWEQRTRDPMLDLSLFRNPRFTAASGSVAISFFALSGFIFLVTQYFQFLKGYGPLSTGVRLLPVAITVAVSSILGTRLAVRIGTKLVVAAGLSSMAAFYLWVTTTTASTSYVTIAAQMVAARHRNGPHQRARHRGDHGRRPEGESRRRVGGQRRHPAARRHPRRRRDRQHLRLALRQPTHQRPPLAAAGHRRPRHARISRRRAHRRRRTWPLRPPGARGGRPERGKLSLLPRLPHRQLRLRRRRRHRRPDGARTTPRPPHRQHRRHARYTSTVSPAQAIAPANIGTLRHQAPPRSEPRAQW